MLPTVILARVASTAPPWPQLSPLLRVRTVTTVLRPPTLTALRQLDTCVRAVTTAHKELLIQSLATLERTSQIWEKSHVTSARQGTTVYRIQRPRLIVQHIPTVQRDPLGQHCVSMERTPSPPQPTFRTGQTVCLAQQVG